MDVENVNAKLTAFLEKAKRLMSIGKYTLVPRKKNMQALLDHGLTMADAKNEIMELAKCNVEVLRCMWKRS